ncbi:MAG: hypothetical protein ABSG91_24700 [Syntrophobacteraceae bacterium]|jgi:hypothetical protein
MSNYLLSRHDPDVLSSLREILAAESRDEERTVNAMDLVEGMILARDVRLRDGRTLVAKGFEVNRTLRERIKNFYEKPGIKEPIAVIVPAKLVLDGK